MRISTLFRSSKNWFLFPQLVFLVGCGNNENFNDASVIDMSVEFKDPAADYRPGAFWCWLNGNMSREAISRDLKEMSEKGMGRAEIWDVAAS